MQLSVRHFDKLSSHPPLPRADEIHCWFLNLRESRTDYARLLSTLDQGEQAKARAFATDELNHNFVLRRGMIRCLAGPYLGVDPANLERTVGKHGKPGFENNSSLRFSVSYSRDRLLAGFCLDKEIGVDLEFVDPLLDMESLASRILSRHEIQAFEELVAEKRKDWLYQRWTMKEAALKAAGTGFQVEPHEVDFFGSQASAGCELSDSTSIEIVEHGQLAEEYCYSIAVCGQ